MTAAAADRFGEQLAVVDGDTQLSYAELLDAGPHASAPPWWRRASSPATGWPSGPSTAPSGSSPCWACSRPAPCWCRSTHGSRASRRRTSCAAAGARVLVTVTDFLGHRLRRDAARRRRRAAPTSPPSWSPAARPPPGRCRGPTSSAGPPTRPGPRSTGGGRGRRARRSLRHPLHLGHDRRAQGRGADPRPHAAGGHRLGGHDRADRRRPLPHGEPVLPHVRPEGRHPGLGRGRRHDAARGRCSTSTGCWPGSPTRRSRCCPGAPTLYQAHPRPPRSRPLRPVQPAGGGHRRGRHPGRAHPPGRRRAAVLDRSSPATASPRAAPRRPRRPTTTSRRSPPPSVGPGPGFELRIVDGDGGEVAAGRAGRDPAAGRQHHVALPRRSRGDRGGAVDRRVVAHRRPRRDRRRGLPAHRRSRRRTCSSSAASTPTRPRSRTRCCATPTSSRPR